MRISRRQQNKYCNVCKIQLNDENSYLKHGGNLLCKTHYNLIKNAQKKATGYRASKEYYKKNAKRMYKKYPERWRARSLVNYAVKTGALIKPKHCERCKDKKVEGHHEDYSKPLEVMWLCRKHHYERHGELKVKFPTSTPLLD